MKRFIFALLILASMPLHAMNLGQMRTEVRTRLKDISSTRQRFTDTQINNIINEAYRDVNNMAWPIRSVVTVTLVAGTTFYSVPGSNSYSQYRAVYNNAVLPETTQFQLDSQYGNGWASTKASAPTLYYFDDTYQNNVGFYPAPSATGSNVTFYIYQQMTDLASDSDVPFLSATKTLTWHDLLVNFTCFRLFEIEGDTAMASSYRQEYEARLQLFMDRSGAKPNYIPGFAAQRQ